MNNVDQLNDVLKGYKVKSTCVDYEKINHFNIFQLRLNPGCKLRSLEDLSTEIQLGMKLSSKPLFMLSPDTGMIKMISADPPATINAKDLIDSTDLDKLEIVLGIDSEGNKLVVDMEKMPHLLVAGTTGSGKSVFLHTLISNFLLKSRTEGVKLYLFDPKFVEFENYKKYEGLMFMEVKNKYEEVISSFELIKDIMDKRFKFISKHKCGSISEFNKKYKDKLPRIICVVDELADFMLQDRDKSFEQLICAIAAKSRAAGIHLVLATQRPSVDVITGLIKANFPVRVCFKVSSHIDSRVVLDYKGAEDLLPRGDGILSGYHNKIVRFQSAYANASMI